MNNNKKYFVETFGCQINKANSEKISSKLEQDGYLPAQAPGKADLVVINTCSVRKTAEDRVFGLVNNLYKLEGTPKIIVTGCILYHTDKWLSEMLPHVDQFIATEELIDSKSQPKREDDYNGWVQIMTGCTNYCSYCVVPYARGPEKSRPIAELYCEISHLAEKGFRKVTLLGQNVNSYGKDFSEEEWNEQIKELTEVVDFKLERLKKKYSTPFSLLIAVVNEVEGIETIRLMTSNPWDLTEDILYAIKLPKVEKYLHLPVQSGDDEILNRMNRDYTAEEYLNLVDKAREIIPGLEIGTDIIVGFPGETKEQFQNTVELAKKADFCVGYIAKYSPRPGTNAARLEDNVPYNEKKRRWKIIDDLINK
jgi:tRNA-2-methylthio-N6-dimethylallyladenosine synthase